MVLWGNGRTAGKAEFHGPTGRRRGLCSSSSGRLSPCPTQDEALFLLERRNGQTGRGLWVQTPGMEWGQLEGGEGDAQTTTDGWLGWNGG